MPYVTVSREEKLDPQGREKHVRTHWWDGTTWQKVLVAKELPLPPFATAEARLEVGVQHDLIHAWRKGNVIEWRAFDPTTGVMVPGLPDFFAAPHKNYAPGLDIRSSDNEPAFTFFDNLAVPQGMYYARWSGGALVANQHLMSCADAHTPLHLRADDRFVVACSDTPAAPSSNVILGFQDGLGFYQEEPVFGAADNDLWTIPDLAIVGDTVVVAAANQTEKEIWIRTKTGAAPWAAPVRLIDFAPGDPLFGSLAVAAREQDGGLLIGVHAMSGGSVVGAPGRLFYSERRPDGSIPTVARVDLNEEGFGATCGVIGETGGNVDLFLPNADDAWLNWFNFQGAEPVNTSRFTSFRREDQRTFTNTNNLSSMPYQTATLALDGEGDNWRCFYDESPLGAPKIAVFIQHRDDAPILVEDDTSAAPNPFARGCDLAVDDDGDVHVVWNNATTDNLRSTFFDGVAFSAFIDLKDTHGFVPATGHVAITVSHDGRTSTVYQRPIAGNNRACVLDTLDQIFYTTTCFPQNAAGAFPDISQLGPWGYARGLVYNAGGTVRVAITNAFPGGWVDEHVVNDNGFDFGIAGRQTSAGSRLMVVWTRFGAGQGVHIAERVGLGMWNLGQVEAASVEFTNIELDTTLHAAISWKEIQPGGGTLRMATWEKWGGGRIPPAAPVGAYIKCDINDSEFGNALELDKNGNIRLSHRTAFGTAPNNELNYISRP